MSDVVAVKIHGLREFRAKLKALDADLPKALRLAFNAAADVVVADAQPRVPRLTGAARASITSRSTQTTARVKGGGSKAPYYPWLDFGGQIGNRSGKAVGERGKRPFLKEGRYIYDAYYRKRDSGEFVEAMSKALTKVARAAGLEVRH